MAGPAGACLGAGARSPSGARGPLRAGGGDPGRIRVGLDALRRSVHLHGICEPLVRDRRDEPRAPQQPRPAHGPGLALHQPLRRHRGGDPPPGAGGGSGARAGHVPRRARPLRTRHGAPRRRAGGCELVADHLLDQRAGVLAGGPVLPRDGGRRAVPVASGCVGGPGGLRARRHACAVHEHERRVRAGRGVRLGGVGGAAAGRRRGRPRGAPAAGRRSRGDRRGCRRPLQPRRQRAGLAHPAGSGRRHDACPDDVGGMEPRRAGRRENPPRRRVRGIRGASPAHRRDARSAPPARGTGRRRGGAHRERRRVHACVALPAAALPDPRLRRACRRGRRAQPACDPTD
jgi:hypothetical protein